MSEGFSCAVTANRFEKLKESDTVQIMDWHGMGSMTEFDVYVFDAVDLFGCKLYVTHNRVGSRTAHARESHVYVYLSAVYIHLVYQT